MGWLTSVGVVPVGILCERTNISKWNCRGGGGGGVGILADVRLPERGEGVSCGSRVLRQPGRGGRGGGVGIAVFVSP